MASSPAYAKHPEHQIEVEANPGRVRVEFAGETIADSTRALRVTESHHEPLLYFPREDVEMLLLEKTAHNTFCPFKGSASYWSIRVGDRVAENAIWSYEEPYDEVVVLRECMAFYVDRIDALREG
jgi:uncharacterized protein (DUF427 family)